MVNCSKTGWFIFHAYTKHVKLNYCDAVNYICKLFKSCSFTVVTCPMPPNPMNGMIDCSLGDDVVLSYEDTCTATCDTGYMLTGDAMRTCQSDRMFSGIEAVCNRGKLYTCFTLIQVLFLQFPVQWPLIP